LNASKLKDGGWWLFNTCNAYLISVSDALLSSETHPESRPADAGIEHRKFRGSSNCYQMQRPCRVDSICGLVQSIITSPCVTAPLGATYLRQPLQQGCYMMSVAPLLRGRLLLLLLTRCTRCGRNISRALRHIVRGYSASLSRRQLQQHRSDKQSVTKQQRQFTDCHAPLAAEPELGTVGTEAVQPDRASAALPA